MKALKLLKATYLALIPTLASCSGVRNCVPPQITLPQQYSDTTADSLTVADIEWSAFFTDTLLVQIIEKTLASNPDMLIAASKVEQMRQLNGISQAAYAPHLDAQAYAQHETNKFGGGDNKIPEYDLKLNLSWEADLLGGLSWTRRKGVADYRASIAEKHGVQVALVAEAATAYFCLLALDNELRIARQTLFTREENMEKARLRYQGGLTGETVFRQAEVEYATTAALIPEIENRIRLQQNGLTLLMGDFPHDVIRRGTLLLADSLPCALPVGVPSQLLRRRPDIARAEAALQSALADAAIARADCFPKFNIALSAGLKDNAMSELLKSPFTFVLGQLAGTVLDFGRRHHAYRARVEAFNQASQAYRRTIITAVTEVDNAIATLAKVNTTCHRRRELLEASAAYARLAHIQYAGGTISYLDVLDAQRRHYDAQIGLSNALRDQCIAIVNLYRALGGGWSAN